MKEEDRSEGSSFSVRRRVVVTAVGWAGGAAAREAGSERWRTLIRHRDFPEVKEISAQLEQGGER